LGLNIGPVRPGLEEARRQLINLTRAHQPPYHVPKGERGKIFKLIFSRRFLRPEDYLDAAHGDIEARIRAQWEEFKDRDLSALVAPIQEAASSISTSMADGEATSETTSGLTSEALRGR
jgi:hypothetical protein